MKMSYNIIKFDVEKCELIVKDIESIAKKFDETVEFKEGKFWINENGEGIELRFRQEEKKYVLEHIDSEGEYSGNNQEIIKEIFKSNNGILLVNRTWEDGENDILNIGG